MDAHLRLQPQHPAGRQAPPPPPAAAHRTGFGRRRRRELADRRVMVMRGGRWPVVVVRVPRRGVVGVVHAGSEVEVRGRGGSSAGGWAMGSAGCSLRNGRAAATADARRGGSRPASRVQGPGSSVQGPAGQRQPRRARACAVRQCARSAPMPVPGRACQRRPSGGSRACPRVRLPQARDDGWRLHSSPSSHGCRHPLREGGRHSPLHPRHLRGAVESLSQHAARLANIEAFCSSVVTTLPDITSATQASIARL